MEQSKTHSGINKITKSKSGRYLMNPDTGSVDSYENWEREYKAAMKLDFPEDQCWNEGDFDTLIEVYWNKETKSWEESKEHKTFTDKEKQAAWEFAKTVTKHQRDFILLLQEIDLIKMKAKDLAAKMNGIESLLDTFREVDDLLIKAFKEVQKPYILLRRLQDKIEDAEKND